VQTLGAVRESQVPAQAAPPLETVKIFGALDWYEKVSVMAFPAEFCAAAVKVKNLPTSRDAFGRGDKLTTAGTSLVITWVELPPPHPARRIHPPIARIVRLRDLPNANRPMNTFREEMKTDVFRKTLSVEAEDFFGNFNCRCTGTNC
jgi:hypothetical protein